MHPTVEPLSESTTTASSPGGNVRSKAIVGAALLAAALGLTACNSSSGGAKDSAGNSSGGSGFKAESVSAAQEMVKKYAEFPSAPDLKPLQKKPSTDHSVVMISCPLPACTPEADAFQE